MLSSCPRSLMLFHRSRSRTSGYTAAPTLSVHACLVLASIPIRSCSVLLPVHAFYPAIYSCPFLSISSLSAPYALSMPVPLYLFPIGSLCTLYARSSLSLPYRLPMHSLCPFLSGTSLYLSCRLPIPLYALLFSLHAHLSTPRRKIWELYMAYSIKRIHAHTYRGDCREVAHERSEHSIRSI